MELSGGIDNPGYHAFFEALIEGRLKLGQTLKAVSSRLGIWLLKGQSNRPDFTKFAIVFYQCTHNLGPAGALAVDTLKRELRNTGEEEEI